MGLSSCSEHLLGQCSAVRRAFVDALSLHVGNLSQHGDDQFTDTSSYRAQAANFHRYIPMQQLPDRRLYVNGISAKPVYSIDVQSVAVSDVV